MIPETEGGGIDYVAHWRTLVEARADQGRRLDTQHRRADEWAGSRADRFRRLVRRTTADDPLLTFLRPKLRPSDVVLDVGAGPGRHAIPLAGLVARVVAVEPSDAMRSHLVERVRESRITNLEVIGANWPDAAVPPADVVICSHVVYGVADIAGFVLKVDATSRRLAVMALRFGQREAPTLDLFAEVWGERRCLAPTCVELLGALAQLGIHSNLVVSPFGAGYRFGSLDEAVEQVRADLLNPEGAQPEVTIRSDLERRLVKFDDEWGFPRPPAYAGLLWWEKS